MDDEVAAMSHGSERLPDFAAARAVFASLEADEGAASVEQDRPRVRGYVVEAQLGSGGGGTVWRGVREGSERPVAIKLLRCRLGEGRQADRAWRELHLLSELRLPCLPRLLDYGEYEGRLFFVTEFVAGAGLLDHCDRARLDRRLRVEALGEVADAVQSIHEHGVLHRDLKPENVIIDLQGHPIIIDLGIASLITDDVMDTLTVDDAPIGTPAFMSPEQARGERTRLSTRSDVYSLGAIAFVLLTGRTPHDMNTTIHEAIRRVAQDEAASPRSLDGSIPRALAAIMSKATARQSDARYASAAALAEDLRRWLRREPVDAQPPSLWVRSTRWLTRHPLVSTTAASAVIGLAIVGTSAWATWRSSIVPSRIVVSEDRQEAQLRARDDRVLRQWPGRFHTVHPLAELVARPASMGGGQMAIIGFNRRPPRWSGSVCAFDVGRELDEPSWIKRVEPETAPFRLPERDISAELFDFRWGDVFDALPNHPGQEILAVFTQGPYSQSVIRLYGLDGELLFQVCHDGTISSFHWMGGAGLLVFSAIDDLGWQKRGRTHDRGRHARVVFAVRPQEGVVDLGWLNRQPEGDGSSLVEWYYGVRSPVPELTVQVANMAQLLLNEDSGHFARVSIRFEENNSPCVELLIGSDGHEIVDARVVAQAEPQQPTNGLDEADFLEPLPRIVDETQFTIQK